MKQRRVKQRIENQYLTQKFKDQEFYSEADVSGNKKYIIKRVVEESLQNESKRDAVDFDCNFDCKHKKCWAPLSTIQHCWRRVSDHKLLKDLI